ncbi:uncharacterized protein L3040_007126 [Drepanopeziza brunnea f. sp. 'multigermtubi']|uniref:uncharacterized protein n=1 Tax=Drepanopeziza brunnea f. sp. 'multigermtubi' TaxID=698441 RepID=UPI002385765F|nr:hypothetical protein L3040_007126 [Drepanopeziza brunnea f. sp. 'multigermtubi']
MMAFPNPNPDPNEAQPWQHEYFETQKSFMRRNEQTSQSNWHINYDYPREGRPQAAPEAPRNALQPEKTELVENNTDKDTEREKEVELQPDSLMTDNIAEEDEEPGSSSSAAEDSSDESDEDQEKVPDQDPDEIGFSAQLREFLRPNFSAVLTGRTEAVYTLPEGADDEDEDEDEDTRKVNEPWDNTRWGHLTDRRHKPRAPGVHRGPRKAAPMTPEISMLLSQANDSFQEQNYHTAAMFALDVIRINAETQQAWTTLATIWQEAGEKSHVAKCLVYAAHLQPTVVSSWMSAARYCLYDTGSEKELFLETAIACYGAAARADRRDPTEARVGQAEVCIEMGKPGSAAIAYAKALKTSPTNLDILRNLAEVCVDADQAQLAIDEWAKAIKILKAAPDDAPLEFSWEDLSTYITLFEDIRDRKAVIREIKSVGRWLNGREKESFWDNVEENDCEWDADDSRRKDIPGFVEMAENGTLMPLEIRVKLGMNRLYLEDYEEAMVHLSCLDPLGGSKIADYHHLFREAADAMFERERHETAMVFYKALKTHGIEVDCEMMTAMARCLATLGDDIEAIAHYEEALVLDRTDVDSRMELAKIYERHEQSAKAFALVNEVMNIHKSNRDDNAPRRKRYIKKALSQDKAVESFLRPDFGATVPGRRRRGKGRKEHVPKISGGRRKRRADEDYEAVIDEARALQQQYKVMTENVSGMRQGDMECTRAWVEAATALTNDFRMFRDFYPWESIKKFMGYSDDTLVQVQTPLDKEIESMAERLAKGLNVEIADNKKLASASEIPKDYRGLSFEKWLDTFLELAMCLAKYGYSLEAYAICEAAKDCVVWMHNREDMFLISTAWGMCSLLSNDEQTAIKVVQDFAKKYQFTTDAYRLVSAVARVCHSPVSWYCAGPMQKFVLREVKTMDLPLVDDATKKKYHKSAGGITNLENQRNTDMDINLLMLYGYILFSSCSYNLAINYFLRCYAMDPENPVINLMIGLSYIADCLKRQTENRLYSILQGTTFMHTYYASRKTSPHLEERQEAHYNMGRAYHMLGLPHLAIPYYQQVLDEVVDGAARMGRDDLVTDTAYNLQTMYANAGNLEMARQITKRWLHAPSSHTDIRATVFCSTLTTDTYHNSPGIKFYGHSIFSTVMTRGASK